MHFATGASAKELVPIYQDLIPRLEQVRGADEAIAVLPEFAGFLAKAGRAEEALETVNNYLTRRKATGNALSSGEILKLDLALDTLIDWGETHPGPYQQLKQYRETGVVQGGAFEGDDPELAQDLATLQGTWQWKRYQGGKVVGRMETNYVETLGTTKFFGPEGDFQSARSGTFKLSRSGAAKVFTFYPGSSPAQGVSFIYTVEKDRFITVSGMLANYGSRPEKQMMVWTRVPDSDKAAGNKAD